MAIKIIGNAGKTVRTVCTEHLADGTTYFLMTNESDWWLMLGNNIVAAFGNPSDMEKYLSKCRRDLSMDVGIGL